MALWLIIGISKNWQSPFFQENFIFAQIWAKTTKNGSQIRIFWKFWKILPLFFLADISPPIQYMTKFWFSSCRPRCCQSIKLQDSLKCNISRKKWMMKFVFCIQINIKVLYKLILSFWVCATRHVQSTQNKKFAYLCNISSKAWEMKLIFCLQINTKVFYKLIVSL